jgi:hypothetical protein
MLRSVSPRKTVWTWPASAVLVGVGHRLSGQLGVRLAAADLLQVDGDEVVGIGLGLRPGQQLLPGVP